MKISTKNSINTAIILFFLFIKATYTCLAQSNIFKEHPKYEVRAVWLTTIGGLDWPHVYAQTPTSISRQKKELTDILDKLQKANINTILLQTRIRGTVIYPSAIEPWDGCCSGFPGKSPGYDPLAFAIKECHNRGMEVHAWIVTIPIGKWNGLGCKTLRKKYPKMITKIGQDGFINPSSPIAAQYLSNICKEITQNYDIDGIHLDYIRYPEKWNLSIPLTEARKNITNIVKKINQSVKSIKPWVKLSCAPIGKFDDLTRYSSRGWNAYNKGCQDAQRWLREGLMDQIYPMMYFRGNQFYPFAMDWKENSYGKTIVPGLGIYFLSPSEGNWNIDEIKRQMHVSRFNGMGYAFFRNRFFCDNVKNLYLFTKDEFNLYPALTPPMKWVNNKRPQSPQNISTQIVGEDEVITWNNVDNNEEGGLMYNVYASKSFPVDIDDARNLLATRIKNNHITIKKYSQNKFYYAITSINRYGNESMPLQQASFNNYTGEEKFIQNDGKKLILPNKGSALDCEYVIIKSLTGNIIAIRPYKGKYADISKINNGCYILLSLNKKNVAHRLGFFIIKR